MTGINFVTGAPVLCWKWQDAAVIELKQRSLWICVVPFLLLACWLGTRSLNAHPLWGDEINSIRDSRGFDQEPYSLPEIWAEVAKVNPDHAPGFFMLLNGWARLTGWQPQTLRFLPLLLGLLGIACTYQLGRRWLGPTVGLAAAIILSVSPFYIFFFTQARVYSLTALLSVFTLSVYLRLINSRRPPSRWLWATLFVAVVLTLYSHYLASLTLIGIGLYHLLFVPKNRRWWTVVAVGVAGALTFAPWIWVLLRSVNRTEQNEFLQSRAMTAPDVLASFVWMFSNGIVVLMFGLLAVVVTTLRGDSPRARHARQVILIALATLIAVLVINQLLKIVTTGRLRYILPLWPLFALVLGLSIAALRRRALVAGVLALWIVGGLWSALFVNFTAQLDGADMVFPVDQIADGLRDHVEKDDIVLNYLPDSMATIKDNIFEYYYKLLGHLPIQYTIANYRDTPEAQANLEKRLWQTFEGQPRIWIVYPRHDVPSGLATLKSQLTEKHYQLCAPLTEEPDAGIDLYVTSGVSCPAVNSSNS